MNDIFYRILVEPTPRPTRTAKQEYSHGFIHGAFFAAIILTIAFRVIIGLIGG